MSKPPEPVEKGLLSLLFSAPLLFGTVEFWSLAFMEVVSFFLLFLWFLLSLRRDEPRISFVIPPLFPAIVALLGLAAVQVVPLPPSLVKLIAPQTYRIYHEVISIEGGLPWLTLSLYPHATILEVVRMLSYFSVYFLTIQLVRDRESMGRMAGFAILTGSVVSLIGIFQVIFWNGRLLWLRELTQGGTPFGSYVNRNHFAGLMEMLVPVSMGMLIHFLPVTSSGHRLRDAFSDFFTHRKVNKVVLDLAALVVMITALFLSLSRGGIVGLCISMLFFGVMLATRNSTRRKGLTIVAVFLLVLVTVGWFGWKPVIDRFERIRNADTSSEYRVHNWKDSWEIIKEFPVFGTGLGTYEHIYPRYKTIPAQEKWEHAHNDYVEGAVELGVPGLATGLFILGAFHLRVFVVLRKRKSLYCRLLAIGGMSGVTAIAVHSLTDFNLHVGANALYLSFLMGFTIAVAHTRVNEGEGVTLLKRKEVLLPLPTRRLILTVVLAFCIILSAIPLLNASAEVYYSIAGGPLKEKLALDTRREMLSKARLLSPLDARLPFAEGTIDYFLERRADAVRNLGRAVSLNPLNGEYLQMYGIAFDNIGDTGAARKYLDLAMRSDPTSAWMRKNYSLWLFSKGEKEAATEQMRKAIAFDPANTRRYITALILSRLTAEEIRQIIPENPVSLYLYGRYREEAGDTEGALAVYLEALSVMKRQGMIRTEVYERITRIYEMGGFLEQALAFYEEGVRNSPSDGSLRLNLARLYERLDIPYRAKEEYEKVLTLHPGNEYAQGRLKEIRKRLGAAR